MLCTLLAPTGGRALVAGYDVATQPGQVRLRIGVALQDAALDPKQTGTELLRLQGRLYGLSSRALARRLAELGELIELGDALGQADELAHRVGIIDHGSIVAEGTPADLKRSVGSDVIVARVDGDAGGARPLAAAVHGVRSVEAHGSELVVAADDGAAAISGVAVALAGGAVAVRDLTLRTPTLDDVFLELTGSHIERKNAQEDPS
jgi:ABC-type multidrug transport system ATPase subunit